jgi:metal-dependent amidase/aminoacylase/carboxypeptidase family protein
VITNLGGKWHLAIYKEARRKKSILFRCELDAYQFKKLIVNYKSIYEGVSHKCGHDGHIFQKWQKTFHENPLRKEQ